MAYTLGIYLLNLFLAFLQPKFDPSLTQDESMEDGGASSSLPTKQDDEFRPFIRRLPEFKFWHAATRAIAIGFICTWFAMFDIPVFWPVLVMYWIILFVLTSTFLLFFNLAHDELLLIFFLYSATTNSAHDQVPLRPFFVWKDEIWTWVGFGLLRAFFFFFFFN